MKADEQKGKMIGIQVRWRLGGGEITGGEGQRNSESWQVGVGEDGERGIGR